MGAQQLIGVFGLLLELKLCSRDRQIDQWFWQHTQHLFLFLCTSLQLNWYLCKKKSMIFRKPDFFFFKGTQLFYVDMCLKLLNWRLERYPWSMSINLLMSWQKSVDLGGLCTFTSPFTFYFHTFQNETQGWALFQQALHTRYHHYAFMESKHICQNFAHKSCWIMTFPMTNNLSMEYNFVNLV